MHETDKVAPLVGVLHRSQGTLAVKTPHVPQDGLQPDAMFVDGPEFDSGTRERRRDLAQQRAQARLEGGLRYWVCLDMAQAWLEEACAQMP